MQCKNRKYDGFLRFSLSIFPSAPSTSAVQRYFRTSSSSSGGTQQIHQTAPTQKDVAHLRFATNCSRAYQLQTETSYANSLLRGKNPPKPKPSKRFLLPDLHCRSGRLSYVFSGASKNRNARRCLGAGKGKAEKKQEEPRTLGIYIRVTELWFGYQSHWCSFIKDRSSRQTHF